MNRRIAPLLVFVVVITGVASGVNGQTLVIQNARLIDGTGAPPRDDVAIVIRDHGITEIGRLAAPPGATVLDARGATVLPGLIDAHVHLKSGPGSALRSAEERRRLRSQHLRAYLACGVTTVLDTGATPRIVREVRQALATGTPGPRYLTLGPFLSPPGGYPDDPDTAQTVATAEDVDGVLDELQTLGVVGVKVALEHGWSPLRDLPGHSADLKEAIRNGARARGLPLYVHATSEVDQLEALAMGAHALMHPILYRGSEPSTRFVERMRDSGAYQVSTLSILDAPLGKFDQERLREPLLSVVVPQVELAAARAPGGGWVENQATIASIVPWLPSVLQSAVASWVFRERAQRAALQISERALRRLHDSGVPIVLGSDTPYQSWAVYAFHGPTTLREVELLAEVGLSPMEAIQASTRVPAEMLGLASEIGTVEVGKRADLVVVRGDPLTDLRALRAVAWTVRDGVARSPQEWMSR